MSVELIQFAYSTFNEKARWALDFKRVNYTKRNLLPGPHARVVKALTGNTITPVVRFDDRYVDESSRVIDELERRYPDPALYPQEKADLDEALRIQQWVDEDIGPRTRRCVLHHIIGDAGYTARLFGEEHSKLVRRLYAMIFPLARPLVRRGNGIIGDAALLDGEAALEEALSFAKQRAGIDGYLVGKRFTVADLSLASILAGAANPPGSTMDRPTPRPPALERWCEQWFEHSGMQWVLTTYAKHR